MTVVSRYAVIHVNGWGQAACFLFGETDYFPMVETCLQTIVGRFSKVSSPYKVVGRAPPIGRFPSV